MLIFASLSNLTAIEAEQTEKIPVEINKDKQIAVLSPDNPDSLSYLMSQFNIQSKHILASAEAYWQPLCQVTDPLALRSIERARTPICKREMTTAVCLARDNLLFPDFIPR